ncbi:hypothetical protein IAQ67_15565 [Paenibacillus peoriae]|uniref:DUF4878 domain-containing protein n=1 Tax=Paenibacillus peoriae TaxID=59893 RepID=A0A7H0Y2K7_9BACL|nr:hypothetical protein [Paenibacillus peoriae]QNR65315.1 hypothetical protein IAQ67_15565 [Paenibacillus peoriae]
MNKPARIISILILSASVGVFAGCVKQETTSPSPSANETVPPATSESTVKEGPGQSAAQHSLDEIKWNEVKDPLIEDGMITKLKAAIAAFVSNDLDQFHAALAPDIGTGHDYLLEHPVKFTGIAEAIKEKDRVLVPIVGKRLTKEEGSSPDVRYTFYFEKNKDGSWQIVSID